MDYKVPGKVHVDQEELRRWEERTGQRFVFLHAELWQKKNGEPHGNTERCAANREQCLGAALAVLKAWPDQCTGCTAIATLVDEKAGLFWPDTSEPPLSHERLTRLIDDWLSKTKKAD
jgi:hypothetical protein